MSRYSVPAKKSIIYDNIDVVLLSAGSGRRMKSFGSKSLLPVYNTTLINYQIQVIKNAIPNAEIMVVLGYEIDKIYKHLPSHVRVVENEKYETTTSTRSAFLGIRACSKNNVVVINGDICFNEKLFEICTSESGILIDNSGSIPKSKIGVIIDDEYISCFNFNIGTKWGQAFHLYNGDITTFQKICIDTKQEVNITEILENMINHKTRFRAVSPKDLCIVEIDGYKDLERIK